MSNDATSECARGIPGTCYEAHERPETAGCGGPDKVQPRQGRFESLAEFRIAVDESQRSHQIPWEKGTAGKVDLKTSCEQNMVNATLGPIIEPKPDLPVDEVSGENDSPGCDSYSAHPGL